jgi:hypothetical protein
VVRAPLILLHASDLSKRRNRYGLAFLLGLEWFTNWAEVTHSGHRVYLIGTLAWGLGIYVAVMTVWTIIESHRDGEVTGYNQGS